MDQAGVEPGGEGPHDAVMEARVTRLEEDMLGVRATLQRLEPMIVRIDAAIPYLATKQEVALLRADVTREMAADRLANSEARAADRLALSEALAAQRLETTIEFGKVRHELAADRNAASDEFSTFRKEMSSYREDTIVQFGKIREELARKPSTAGMWAMAIALVTLVVGAMGAGAVYLPFLFRVLHLPTP